MEICGIKIDEKRFQPGKLENAMLAFCGQDRCLVDGNGRIRLTQRFVDDFLRRCNGEIVMHGLPEGAIALYPEEVYSEMRQREINALDTVGSSFLARRSLRRFGALTQPETISRQGRITLPAALREFAGLEAGTEACVIGVEVGVEIWAAARYAAEMAAIEEHMNQKREQEMAADLTRNILIQQQ